MPSRHDIALGPDARQRLVAGALFLTRCVKPVIENRGSVLLERHYTDPRASRDVSFIARRLTLRDPVADMGLATLREAALETEKEAGAGADLTIVFAGAILGKLRYIAESGADLRALRSELVAAWRRVDAFLEDRAVRDEATLADLLGTDREPESVTGLLRDATRKAGQEGCVIAEPGRSKGVSMDVLDGMTFDSRLLSEDLLPAGAGRISMTRPEIWIYRGCLDKLDPVVPAIESCLDRGRDLVLVAGDITGEARASIMMNVTRGVMNCLPVRAPGFGKRQDWFFDDLALLSGAFPLDPEAGCGLSDVAGECLGRLDHAEATTSRVSLASSVGRPEDIERRLGRIREEMASEPSDFDREKLEERLARLAGATVILSVGGASEGDRDERLDDIRGRLAAFRAGRAAGLLKGEGLSCLEALRDLRVTAGPETPGAAAVGAALEAAFIVADPERRVMADRIKRGGDIPDMAAPAVPAAAVRGALRRAVSLSASLLLCEAAVAKEKKTDESVFR